MVTFAPVGGVTPPPTVVVGTELGAVGDSPLHPANTSTNAAAANRYLRCLNICIFNPRQLLSHPRRTRIESKRLQRCSTRTPGSCSKNQVGTAWWPTSGRPPAFDQ